MISRIRQVSKSVLKEDTKLKQDADEAFYNSQKFEVLYCGKVEKNTTQIFPFDVPIDLMVLNLIKKKKNSR